MDQLDPILKLIAVAVRMMLTVALISVVSPALALAHVFPATQEPMAGSTIAAPPSQAAITFDGPIEELFAKLGVAGADGQDETAGSPHFSSDHRRLFVALKALKPGDYTVKWSVVAQDGHRTEGSFQFTVAGGAR